MEKSNKSMSFKAVEENMCVSSPHPTTMQDYTGSRQIN